MVRRAQTMKVIYSLTAVILISVASGCTIMDGNAIVTGIAKDPISPEQVRLYRTPPAEFEEIAMINASAGHDFKSGSSLMNAAIQRLKEEAAKVGANGVLLSELDERDTPSVSTTYGSAAASGGGTSVYATGNSTSIDRGDSYTRVRGVAIYVP